MLIELTFTSHDYREVSKYRSYIQGLITENLGVMTSKKLLGVKPTLKVHPESCQTQEKLSPAAISPHHQRIQLGTEKLNRTKSMFIQIGNASTDEGTRRTLRERYLVFVTIITW